ncbi:MAG: carboxypeptidase regulatory-like domain-containing protein, partial [Bacteroidetes bacterium]|nr:carboxypeptidase regulatory-like domain-containing protein [Bacteroidota bacterium]
ALGKFGIANIKPGSYDIEVTLVGYNTLTETNIRFAPGKELKRKYILIAILPPPPPQPPLPL